MKDEGERLPYGLYPHGLGHKHREVIDLEAQRMGLVRILEAGHRVSAGRDQGIGNGFSLGLGPKAKAFENWAVGV